MVVDMVVEFEELELVAVNVVGVGVVADINGGG
jgi:hypothetical protein